MSAQNTTDIVPPAEVAEEQRIAVESPTTIDSPPQQEVPVSPSANGSPVRADQIKKPSEVNRDDPNINVVDLPPPGSPKFKEQVYGYARLIRGTVLGKSDVKEQGTQVLRGEQSVPLRRGSQSSK